ncbi:MAG: hypothetical protein ACP5IK_02650, partial [Candidatus Micrarchaeia archaeon]
MAKANAFEGLLLVLSVAAFLYAKASFPLTVTGSHINSSAGTTYNRLQSFVNLGLTSSSGGSGTSCSDYCNAGISPTSYSSSGCAYTSYTYNTYATQQIVGYLPCGVQESITTSYQQSEYILTPMAPNILPQTYEFSPANEVNYSNSQTATALLICPLTSDKNPTTQDYFYTYPYTGQFPYIAGAACESTTSQLQTNVILPLTITWSNTQFASGTVGNMKVLNPADLQINILAMSPMLEGLDIISNGFTSNTYIFQQVPSVAQHAIWTWYAPFADFDNAQPNKLHVSINPQYVVSYSCKYPLPYCTYLPSFSFSGKSQQTGSATVSSAST